MSRWIAYMVLGIAVGTMAYFGAIDVDVRTGSIKSIFCCEKQRYDPVARMQQNPPEKSLSRALCGQHHGSVIEVDGIFVDCIGGN